MRDQYNQQSLPQTPQDIALGRELGRQMAVQLVQYIQAMGLPATQATADSKPGINDSIACSGALM